MQKEAKITNILAGDTNYQLTFFFYTLGNTPLNRGGVSAYNINYENTGTIYTA